MPSLSRFQTLREAFRGYTGSLVFLCFLGFGSALLEGIGVNIIIPLLSFLTNADVIKSNFISKAIEWLFNLLHISYSFAPLAIFIVVVFILRALVMLYVAYKKSKITAEIISDRTKSLFSLLLNTSWTFLLKQKMGYIQNTIARDVQRTGNLFEVFAQAIQSLTGFLIYLVVALSISPLVTGITALAGFIMIFFLKPFIRQTNVISDRTSHSERELNQRLNETTAGLKSIKASGFVKTVYERASQNIDTLKKLYAKSALTSSLSAVFIQPFAMVFILAVFALDYKSSNFSLAAFIATIYLIQKIFVYLESGQGAIHSVSQFIPNVRNVIEFQDLAAKHLENIKHTDLKFELEKEISFQNVDLLYESNKQALSGINLTIPKGKTIALIGHSGSGKTSIADLLLRLFEPTKGKILADGNDLSAIDLEDWRKKVAYVSQDMFLFHDTIRNNIMFFREGISDEEMKSAAQKAYISEFIEGLPNGYDTVIGDRGVALSVGQRQRIVLARSLLQMPKILILDEATSALDVNSEKMVHDSLLTLKGKVTILIIAHRLSTIVESDYIYVLDEGKVIEHGTPKDLLANQDSYFSTNYRKAQI